MLHAGFFRSPVAHARLASLDLAGPRGMAGVVAAYGAADVRLPPLHPPIANPEAYSPPRALLADGVVRFVGEPLAMIVAESPYVAEDASELVDASLELRPALVGPRSPRSRRSRCTTTARTSSSTP